MQRIRPQIARELIDNLGICTSVTPSEPQVQLGKGNLFTYDHVFDMLEIQEAVYEACVAQLVEGALEGYNATTGSGKTYTMGTGFEVTPHPDQIGILPRAIRHIYAGITARQERAREAEQPVPEFRVEAQFIELYNENLFDLLEPSRDMLEAKNIRIHGDHFGGISVEGVIRTPVRCEDDALSCLRQGALSRTTGETQMNTQSSRSHAIFTLHIQQRRLAPEESEDKENGISGDFETLSSKFHFVDLAGSERLHRTGATGERAREGISINCGLLALGNVISALGDKSKKALHVPYRDSKLTRLLQDSLGGNSRTVMIACISPSTQDFMETLSTLKYANRARNIKNRVTINQDKFSQQVTQLRQEIQRLQLELMEFKQGKRMVGEDGSEAVNDMYHENKMLMTDNSNLRLRLKAQQDTIETLTARNAELKTKIATSSWISGGGDAENSNQIHDMLNNYVKEIEDLTSKLTESEAMCQQLRAAASRVQNRTALLSPRHNSTMDFAESPSVTSLIEVAKKGLQKDVDLLQRSKSEVLGSKGERESDELGNDDDEEDESDDESEESSDSDSEEEKNNAEEEARMGELVSLESEINIKQQLIEQLELSQRRMHSMKQQYEDKLRQLEARMEATKVERDKVLASLSGNMPQQDGQAGERVRRVKEEYERKLSTMQKELKTLQTAKKEHAKMLKEHSRNENQLRSLKNELGEMKRAKVKLLNRMKEESARHKQEQERRNRELAQLRKANRKHENQIRSLEADRRAKEIVLKRRQEEVSALRRNQYSGMSSKAAGKPAAVRKGGSSAAPIPTDSLPPLPPGVLPALLTDIPRRNEAMRRLYRGVAVLQTTRKGHHQAFSPKAAKQKWSMIEKNINQVSITKKTIADLEKQLEL
ncbi:hypothetical protein B566_EDAN016577 [Ephemera danica]|nr:hypothetical protein B566_EDAN016577 [Ephemera danica]